MCGSVLSQPFVIDASTDGTRLLLRGPVVLTDIHSTKAAVTAGAVLRLRDGQDANAKVIFELTPTGIHPFSDLRFVAIRALFAEWVAGPGPNFAEYIIGAHVKGENEGSDITDSIHNLVESVDLLSKKMEEVRTLGVGRPSFTAEG